ncbi:Tetratricopeptide repeat-containing protein [Sphingomonas palmae]|uniref:Tetratricopeptide repeat-containing protein n=1 Tax=Sphingomonas palmae TaxID=1855283 RepID=A0A1H7U6C9_9SPHN|nr:tetratricopeptide repeat protein [Sphingomonas palmae]SEL92305.1 Tetratricopeptide repeat-containing protein [Sphingomonas palmae]
MVTLSANRCSAKKLVGIGLSALLLGSGGVMVVQSIDPAVATQRSDPKKAAGYARKASAMLGKQKWDKAVRFAEAAVANSPGDAGYRMILGNAYLRAGRFDSARATYGDVLSLQPANAKAALNLALAQTALGQWDAARQMLDGHANVIAPVDRGLAIALAGDPNAGIEVLTAAARAPDADAKTRQNLALALALGGRWQDARTLIGYDMNPAEADMRIIEWAAFAHPTSSASQVASLLGITPAADPGQPVAIALNAAVAPTRLAAADPVDNYMPGPPEAAPKQVAAAAPQPAIDEIQVAQAPAPEPATPREAKPEPVRLASLIKPQGAYKVRGAEPMPKPQVEKVAVKAPAPGHWYVQLGAYENAAVARDGWARASRRYPTFAGLSPAGMSASVKGANYYRLSVGGFARADADRMCRGYRVKGGRCFVRQQAGDQVAAWVKGAKGVQVASR